MATKKKFDIENPTDEMIENLQASQPGEDGFHITKLSERDSKTLLDLLQNPPAPNEELKKAREAAKRLILNYESFSFANCTERIYISLDSKSTSL